MSSGLCVNQVSVVESLYSDWNEVISPWNKSVLNAGVSGPQATEDGVCCVRAVYVVKPFDSSWPDSASDQILYRWPWSL